MNQPPIQFLLRPDSPIRNDYNNSNSSQVDNGGNQIEVGMDDYLRDTTAMETMLLDVFQNDDQLRDDAHIANTFFESLNFLPPPLSLDLAVSQCLPSWGQ